jgi:hypothetical protein
MSGNESRCETGKLAEESILILSSFIEGRAYKKRTSYFFYCQYAKNKNTKHDYYQYIMKMDDYVSEGIYRGKIGKFFYFIFFATYNFSYFDE